MKNALLALLSSLYLTQQTTAQNVSNPARSKLDPAYAPFYHGVASGDPLPDRVIIWTRVTTQDPTVSVTWQIATDTLFTNVVNSGTVTTSAAKDYTVKLDATGLQPKQWYYYRFNALGSYSVIGRTRTADVGNNDSLRFAVVSCSNYQAGYFNVYNHIANRNDIDAVIHLGDYIYEYGKGGYGATGDSNRVHEPANEILTLSDYRIRHSQYCLDPDLRAMRQQYPLITVWDDHETANDAYRDGAQNHATDGSEGAWADRRSYGEQAYFEWLPIRDYNPGDSIYRKLPLGNLVDLIMIDTRLEGREKQVTTSDPLLNDTNRTLLGMSQLNWFKNQLSNSTAQWKIIGNQVMIAPLYFSGAPLNLDQWDGYPEERKKVLSHIANNQIKNVVWLTGDIHTAWGNDVPLDRNTYNPATRSGSVAVEFVCTSVTSPGLPSVNNSMVSIAKSQNPYMQYIDLEKKGYLLLDVNKQRVQGDWVLFNTVGSKTYTTTIGGSYFAENNKPWLQQASSAAGSRPNAAPFAPIIQSRLGVNDNNPLVVVSSIYPNPTDRELKIQYSLFKKSKITISITDASGKLVKQQSRQENEIGLLEREIEVHQLPAGTYNLIISANGVNSFVRKFIKK